MKNFIIYSITILFIACNACIININGSGVTIKGSGNIINESRELEDFHTVEIVGSVDADIASGESFSCNVQGDDNLVPLVKTTVTKKTLEISTEGNYSTKNSLIVYLIMPVLDKAVGDGSYEGAICLPPETGLYIDEPVAVVDYSSLYPSSMISENISHDSKVWTKEYDLDGNLIEGSKKGITDKSGNFIYDNLPNYKYVNVEYDRFRWTSKTPNGPLSVKKKVGTKICRFAQFPDGKKGIMPTILEYLLAARKATRVLIKYKTVTTNEGEKYEGLLKQKNGKHSITQKNGETIDVSDDDVKSVEDTYDDFMKNVFNKRQLGYKVTANSLYGQCGAKTSSFLCIEA